MKTLSEKLSAHRQFTVGCLFSGMGGFATGLIRAGFGVTWATDNDSCAGLTFRHRFPTVPFIEADIQDLKTNQLSPVDVLAGGFPCQSFSQAGSRGGFDDPRGRLFYEIPRLIGEWPDADRPKILLLENVPYLMYGADGLWFDKIRHALRKAGYWFRDSHCWLANVREHTDSPQDRERLFLVAASKSAFAYNPFSPPTPPCVNGTRRRTVLDIVDRTTKASNEDYLPPDNQYRRMIVEAMADGESSRNLYQLRRNYVREKKNGLCPTLTANMGIGGHNVPFVQDRWGIRRLRVSEVAQLQGFDEPKHLFPDDVPSHERYRLIGNAACPRLVEIAARSCLKALVEECNA